MPSPYHSDDLFIRLFHGRDRATEELSDWGFSGPLIGPVGLSWTYGEVKLHAPGWVNHEELPVIGDLIAYDGKFYGDFEVFDRRDAKLTKKALREAHSFDKFLETIQK